MKETVISPGRYFRFAAVGAFFLFSALLYHAFSAPLERWLRVVSAALSVVSAGGLIDAFVSRVVSHNGAFRIVGLLQSVTIRHDEIDDVIIEDSAMFIKKKDGRYHRLPDWVATTQKNKHKLLNELKSGRM